MGMVINCLNLPAMLLGKVNESCKTGVGESKPSPGVICLWDDAQDGIHHLVQNPAMRYHQVTSSRSLEQFV